MYYFENDNFIIFTKLAWLLESVAVNVKTIFEYLKFGYVIENSTLS